MRPFNGAEAVISGGTELDAGNWTKVSRQWSLEHEGRTGARSVIVGMILKQSCKALEHASIREGSGDTVALIAQGVRHI